MHLNSLDDKVRIMEKASGDLLVFWMNISREHAKSEPSDMPHLLVQLRPQIVQCCLYCIMVFSQGKFLIGSEVINSVSEAQQTIKESR